jgi:hypothetical protein
MPGSIELGIILAILLTLSGIAAWIYKSGGDNEEVGTLRKKITASKVFQKNGEAWDKAGGLGGAVARKLKLRK